MKPLNRRQFLKYASYLAATGLLAACSRSPAEDDEPTPSPPTDDEPEPEQPTPTPEPDPTPDPEPNPDPDPSPTQELEAFDLLILAGQLVDGSGEPRFRADIGIREDRIVALGDLAEHQANQIIDAEGFFVAPGFVNTHSHVEEWIAEGRPLIPSLRQGVTTEIAGMDGESYLNIAGHLKDVEQVDLEVNYGSVIGHAAVRREVLGEGNVQPDQQQLDEMRSLIDQGLQDGAFGFSTGLEYVPGVYAQSDEIIALAEIASGYDVPYSTHMRYEGRDIIAAVEEAIDAGRQSGVTVVITHLKVRRVPDWPENPETLRDLTDRVIKTIHAARDEGIDVWADTYPYTTTWGNIEQQLSNIAGQYPPEIMTVSRAANESWLDRRIDEIAEEWGVDPATAIDEILASSPDARVSIQGAHPDSIRRVLEQDFTMIAIDNPVGTGRWSHPGGDVLHPRTFGTYPRLLGQFVRDEGLLEWEEAVHRSSGLPATRYRVEGRGFIREGYFADLVIFDPETVEDRTTPANPETFPAGIQYVLVNGVIAVAEGDLVPENDGHRTPGRVLRRT